MAAHTLMISLLTLLLFAQGAVQPASKPPDRKPEHAAEIAKLVKMVAESGRIVEIATLPTERVSAHPQIAPGVPPLVSFRMFEGTMRHRFSNLDLMMDDAGH